MRTVVFLLAGILSGSEITGALVRGNHVITWGSDLREWTLNPLRSRILTAQTAARNEGGCLFEDGIALQENGQLILRRPPDYAPELIDRQIDMHDCLSTPAGILVLHRHTQLRLYRHTASGWTYRELYSIYTNSKEAGLLAAPFGLIVGNYWMDTSWREYAINTWSETPDSATLRLAWLGPDLIVAQGHMAEARLARFSPPADRTQLWNELRLGEDLQLRYPHALATAAGQLAVGENAGPGSRLYLFPNAGPPVLLGTTTGTHSAFFIEGQLVTVGNDGVRLWPLSDPADKHHLRSASPRGRAQRYR